MAVQRRGVNLPGEDMLQLPPASGLELPAPIVPIGRCKCRQVSQEKGGCERRPSSPEAPILRSRVLWLVIPPVASPG